MEQDQTTQLGLSSIRRLKCVAGILVRLHALVWLILGRIHSFTPFKETGKLRPTFGMQPKAFL